MTSLPSNVNLFNQLHALIVVAAKTFCRKRPECADCPLAVLNTGRKIG
jgi:endonuclease-3 related protein